MKKSKIAFCVLLAAAVINLTSCETLLRAFADQTGRNAADALWGKRAVNTEPAASAPTFLR